ncbi:MAG: antiviral RADAR system accessory protein RdrD [Plesiomonas shigelloides]
MSINNTAIESTNSNSNNSQINHYTTLITALTSEKERLNRKSNESYWLRYTFRRIPLFFGAGLIFYAACLAMSMVKSIGLQSVNLFITSINSSITPKEGSLISDLITQYVNPHCIYTSLFIALFIMHILIGRKCRTNDDFCPGSKLKAITDILLLSLSASIFLITIKSESPLIPGLITYLTLAALAILTERMLGFTRRNERYRLFADRAEALVSLFTRRRDFNIEFKESYLIEVFQFQEELQLRKYNDTVADSHYLLTLVEQLKAPSK